jgi:hypothetical protein
MTPEQSEQEAADAIVDYAFTLVKRYVDHPGDVDAAMVAVLATSIEKIINKEIVIERLYV